MSDATYSSNAKRGSLSGLFGGIARSYGQYRVYRTTLSELQSLGDRELADLGLSRSALRSVAYKAAYDV